MHAAAYLPVKPSDRSGLTHCSIDVLVIRKKEVRPACLQTLSVHQAPSPISQALPMHMLAVYTQGQEPGTILAACIHRQAAYGLSPCTGSLRQKHTTVKPDAGDSSRMETVFPRGSPDPAMYLVDNITALTLPNIAIGSCPALAQGARYKHAPNVRLLPHSQMQEHLTQSA